MEKGGTASIYMYVLYKGQYWQNELADRGIDSKMPSVAPLWPSTLSSPLGV